MQLPTGHTLTQLQGTRLWKHPGHSQGIPPPAPTQPHTARGGIREQLPNFGGENSDGELSGRWLLWHRHRGTSRMQEQPANSACKHAFQCLVVQKLFLQNTNYICILCCLIIHHRTDFSGTNAELKMCYLRHRESLFKQEEILKAELSPSSPDPMWWMPSCFYQLSPRLHLMQDLTWKYSFFGEG